MARRPGAQASELDLPRGCEVEVMDSAVSSGDVIVIRGGSSPGLANQGSRSIF